MKNWMSFRSYNFHFGEKSLIPVIQNPSLFSFFILISSTREERSPGAGYEQKCQVVIEEILHTPGMRDDLFMMGM